MRKSYTLGTATHFDFKQDGQTIMYTQEGSKWTTVNFSLWPDLTKQIMSNLEARISMQLPEAMRAGDLLQRTIDDDFSPQSPHLQHPSNAWMEERLHHFKAAMMSERHHQLFEHGELHQAKFALYLQHDQEIRGLLATLVAITTSVCLRPAQFQSIVVNSGDDNFFKRNLWILNGRFLFGKPKAKQRNKQYYDTLYWLPSGITRALSLFLFFQQPLISDLLPLAGVKEHQYSTHLWPSYTLPSRGSESKPKQCGWDGKHINSQVFRHTKAVLKIGLDCQTVRSMAEGYFRQKFPSLFEDFNVPCVAPRGSYHIDNVLQPYAHHYSLEQLVVPAEMEKDRISACLMVSDIWQAIIRAEPQRDIWRPISTDTFLFPAILHRDHAYHLALHLKETVLGVTNTRLTIDILSRGLLQLEKPSSIMFDLPVSCLLIESFSIFF